MVPRSQRRGLFSRFTVIPEVENPYEYSNGTKWWMTIIVSIAAATSATGSSIFYREYTNLSVPRRICVNIFPSRPRRGFRGLAHHANYHEFIYLHFTCLRWL